MPVPLDAASRELKVKIPVRLVQRLHSDKILRGRTIQDTVTAALESYFAR